MRINRALRSVIFKLGGSAPHTDEDYPVSSVIIKEEHVREDYQETE
jgi:hypothetical protein